MEIKEIILISSPFIAAFLTYWLGWRTKSKEQQLLHKQEKYEKLLIAIRNALYQNNTNSNMQTLLDIKISAFLYASDEVIEYLEVIMNRYISIQQGKSKINNDDANEQNKKLINAIRKDLGGKESKLDPNFFPFDHTYYNP